MEDTAHPLLRSYGRIKSRPIKPRQAALVETLLPQIRAPQAPFDPADLMPGAEEVWLEIGFGGGEHMASQAARAVPERRGQRGAPRGRARPEERADQGRRRP